MTETRERRRIESLRLSRASAGAIVDHLRDVYPEEGCGLLAVAADDETVLHQYRIRNVAREPRRHYLGDEHEVVAALLDIEARDWRLGAIYHSHPHGPAWPSQEDISQAYYPEALSLLVSLADPTRPDLRLFAIRRGQVEVRALIIADELWETR